MKKTLYIAAIIICQVFISCERLDLAGMFAGQSPDNDKRFEQSREYIEKNGHQPYGLNQISVMKDEYKVYFSTDTHVSDTWNNLSKWSAIAENDADCKLAIILGDLIDAQGNYPNFMKGISPLSKPWYVTTGNHDLYFGQWKDFTDYFGSSVYSFEVLTPNAKDLYICLDSGDGTLGVKQLNWLKETLEDAQKNNYRHKLIFTHTHMFKRDLSQEFIGNYAIEETYEICDVLGKYGVDWYVTGHDHYREVSHFKDVTYIIVDTMKDSADKPAYMIASIGDKMKYDFVELY